MRSRVSPRTSGRQGDGRVDGNDALLNRAPLEMDGLGADAKVLTDRPVVVRQQLAQDRNEAGEAEPFERGDLEVCGAPPAIDGRACFARKLIRRRPPGTRTIRAAFDGARRERDAGELALPGAWPLDIVLVGDARTAGERSFERRAERADGP